MPSNWRRVKKATKARNRAESALRRAESVGPERGGVLGASPLTGVESVVLEEARHFRERKHPPQSKAEIVALGLAKSEGVSVELPGGGSHGKKPKGQEHSANAYRKARIGPVRTRKRSSARKGGGAGLEVPVHPAEHRGKLSPRGEGAREGARTRSGS